jgi:uncharacterized protein YdcH (DUF465 family)
MMYVDHHDLDHEFPEFVQGIQELKAGNAEFAKLYEEYNSLTSNVEDLEGKDIPVDDFAFEALKKKRVRLKDELYSMLVAQKR